MHRCRTSLEAKQYSGDKLRPGPGAVIQSDGMQAIPPRLRRTVKKPDANGAHRPTSNKVISGRTPKRSGRTETPMPRET